MLFSPRYLRPIVPKPAQPSLTPKLRSQADVDIALDVSKNYSIRSMPTFKFIRYSKATDSSEVIETLRGSSPPALEAAVKRNRDVADDDEAVQEKFEHGEESQLQIVIGDAEFVDGPEWGATPQQEEARKRRGKWGRKVGQAVLLAAALWVGKDVYLVLQRSIVQG